ncbi:universal stress protein [Oceanicoccus sagamiensis]|uniref:UspA domain-containing protein n=1 Tax=Oceanicoccus sagamiensis TaxID=716816 RepID=A0A1X9NJ08_9GAMM|nr:universal stress protein [Oceanicoccus sagamiensis]ARN75825.1 hypothetical protein BST96_17970 [Oceanicoccus sagamiensis]
MWRPSNILCIHSFEDSNQDAVQRAIALANNLQAKLTVATFIPLSSGKLAAFFQGDPDQLMIDEREQALQAIVEPLKGSLDIQCSVISGTTYQEVIQHVLANDYDLLLKTAGDEATKSKLFGGYDMGLLRQCPCPVWLLKPNVKPEYKSIVAAIDVKDDYPEHEQATRRELNLKVLQTAYSLALAESADLHVVSVWSAEHEGAMRSSGFLKRPDDEVDSYVEGIKNNYQKNYDSLLDEAKALVGPGVETYLEPQIQLIKGEPRQLIPDYANDVNADLVVMGTVARTGIPGFIMGNTAENILSGLSQSVLAIKPTGFTSPVTA